jgi:hypothetical protein
MKRISENRKVTLTIGQLKRLVKEGTDDEYLSFDDLSRDQIIELKQRVLCDMYDKDGESPSWGDLADADELVSDEEVRNEYGGTRFSPEDFTSECNMAECLTVSEGDDDEDLGLDDGEKPLGKWFGDTKCDFCHKECGKTLYDGMTDMGPWAVMCQQCFRMHGVGVGPGKGQKYKKVGSDYVKVEDKKRRPSKRDADAEFFRSLLGF